MLQLLHNILTIYVLPGMILALGLCLLFINTGHYPPEKLFWLRGYQLARRLMGCSYLVFFATLLTELLTIEQSTPPMLQQIIMVSISILQAFLFTHALITLLDVRFFTWRRLLVNAWQPIIPPLAAIIICFTYMKPTAQAAFLALTLYYGILLVNYVLFFNHYYRAYKQRMGNYFSDGERHRLLWVRRSFYASLSIGILALAYSIHPTTHTGIIFTAAMGAYYAVFCIRFINYASHFFLIEEAMTYDILPTESEGETVAEGELPSESCQKNDDADRQLMVRLDLLMTERRLYTKPDLTIEEVAVEAGVSFRCVSSSINHCHGTTFKSWVNSYRIAEAKSLLANGYLQTYTTDSLSAAVGFANRITFYRVFKKHTGMSPSDWVAAAHGTA